MSRKVLITGGSGLLALNWALAIRSQYSVILGLHMRNLSVAGVQARQIPLESVDELAREFDLLKPELVIHTAGFTNVEECERRPEQAFEVNVNLAVNVAQACAKLSVPLVHISTDHMFSGDVPFADETHQIVPQNVYGQTKAAAERQVLEAHPRALMIRTNFFGWGPKYRSSFSDVIIKALRSEKELTLFNDIFYTPILIETAIQAIHELVQAGASGIFHVVGDERISKYGFGQKIAEEFKLDADLIKLGFMADQVSLVRRPYDMSLSNQKICSALGRKMGGVSEHVARLHQQELSGLSQEILNL